MASTKAAKSYAKAIFALAGENDKLDRVRGDLLALAPLREKSSDRVRVDTTHCPLDKAPASVGRVGPLGGA